MSNKGLLVACIFLILFIGVFKNVHTLPPTRNSEQFLTLLEFMLGGAWIGVIYSVVQIIRYKKKPPI